MELLFAVEDTSHERGGRDVEGLGGRAGLTPAPLLLRRGESVLTRGEADGDAVQLLATSAVAVQLRQRTRNASRVAPEIQVKVGFVRTR